MLQESEGGVSGGSALEAPLPAARKRRDDDCRDTPSYRRCYLSNPCVPVDCASISEAIEHVEKLRRRDVAMNYEGK